MKTETLTKICLAVHEVHTHGLGVYYSKEEHGRYRNVPTPDDEFYEGVEILAVRKICEAIGEIVEDRDIEVVFHHLGLVTLSEFYGGSKK